MKYLRKSEALKGNTRALKEGNYTAEKLAEARLHGAVYRLFSATVREAEEALVKLKKRG